MIRSSSSTRRAFSLTELLVVLVIIVILIGIAIPAFRAMSQSQEKVASEARLAFSLSGARDAAIAAGEGNDVAAVFTYEMGGPMKVVTCRMVGRSITVDPRTGVESYDIFVPVPSVEPATMPSGWTVRAYATGGMINNGWYNDGVNTRYGADQPGWVFPETGFFDHTVENDGQNRQTFMVRFEGGTGKALGASTRPALVMLVRPSSQNRSLPNNLRPDLSADLGQLVLTALNDPTITQAQRNLMIGPDSGDMVLTKPTLVLALADEQALAASLGERVDERSGTLYQVTENQVTSGLALSPRLLGTLSTTSINRAIEFHSNPQANDNARNATSEVRLYSIDVYSGSLREMKVPVQ